MSNQFSTYLLLCLRTAWKIWFPRDRKFKTWAATRQLDVSFDSRLTEWTKAWEHRQTQTGKGKELERQSTERNRERESKQREKIQREKLNSTTNILKKGGYSNKISKRKPTTCTKGNRFVLILRVQLNEIGRWTPAVNQRLGPMCGVSSVSSTHHVKGNSLFESKQNWH